uniref:Uncharacterized protein n=1 Tax=Rhizophora mucronata TaxID=61149 RepID=A0A2P2P898_RHIMU
MKHTCKLCKSYHDYETLSHMGVLPNGMKVVPLLKNHY